MTGGRVPDSCSYAEICDEGSSSSDSSGKASRPRIGESASGDGGYRIFSKVSLTIGVCGKAFSSAWGEILSLALSSSPSHISTVGLISLEMVEYRLARARGSVRDSNEPSLDALEMAIAGVDGVGACDALRLRDGESSLLRLRGLGRVECGVAESAVAGRVGFEWRGGSWDERVETEKT